MTTPWAPDPSHAAGTAPVDGANGERGSSAYTGDPNFRADGTITAGDVPDTHYPLHGVDYYATDPGKKANNTSVKRATSPGAAKKPVAARASATSATVTWKKVGTGNSTVTGQVVTSTPGSLTASVSGSATSATVTGLTTGTSYTFKVVATNAVGAGAASPASNAVVP